MAASAQSKINKISAIWQLSENISVNQHHQQYINGEMAYEIEASNNG